MNNSNFSPAQIARATTKNATFFEDFPTPASAAPVSEDVHSSEDGKLTPEQVLTATSVTVFILDQRGMAFGFEEGKKYNRVSKVTAKKGRYGIYLSYSKQRSNNKFYGCAGLKYNVTGHISPEGHATIYLGEYLSKKMHSDRVYWNGRS